jgi:hypothetical protein
VLELACLRYELPVREGRGFDQLPAEVLAPMQKTLVGSLEPAGLTAAFEATIEALLAEIGHVDQNLASRLQPALDKLVATAGGAE